MSAKGFKRMSSTQVQESDTSSAHAPGRDPAAALAAANAVAPTLPPTRLTESGEVDPIAQLNLKVRESLIEQLADVAGREGTTQKVIVCRALAKVGFRVHEDDLSDRGNHRRRRA